MDYTKEEFEALSERLQELEDGFYRLRFQGADPLEICKHGRWFFAYAYWGRIPYSAVDMIARDILSTFGVPLSFEAFAPEDKEEEEESPCIQGISQQVEDDGTRLVKRPRTGSVLPTSSKTEEEDTYCPPIGEDDEYDFFVRGIRG